VNRIVCVTGASQGVGYETAVAFAAAGDTVIATSRDAATAHPVLAPHGIEVHGLDVTDQDSVDALRAFVEQRYGRMDVLVNNAGRGFQGTLEQLSMDDLGDSLAVNFLGAARVTKAFLPMMRTARSGHIIAISSIGGAIGQPFRDAYCAAKFALEGLYESLQPVAAQFGVRVCLVEPGKINSDHDARALHLTPVDDEELGRIEQRYETAASTARPRPPTETAQVVLACADDPQATLRHQTCKLSSRLVAMKLADADGSVITAMTGSWLAPTP
jgi:NAD(P)-dependent dehydrogenase (short-subunit alcohol dehydrogenase family)